MWKSMEKLVKGQKAARQAESGGGKKSVEQQRPKSARHSPSVDPPSDRHHPTNILPTIEESPPRDAQGAPTVFAAPQAAATPPGTTGTTVQNTPASQRVRLLRSRSPSPVSARKRVKQPPRHSSVPQSPTPQRDPRLVGRTPRKSPPAASDTPSAPSLGSVQFSFGGGYRDQPPAVADSEMESSESNTNDAKTSDPESITLMDQDDESSSDEEDEGEGEGDTVPPPPPPPTHTSIINRFRTLGQGESTTPLHSPPSGDGDGGIHYTGLKFAFDSRPTVDEPETEIPGDAPEPPSGEGLKSLFEESREEDYESDSIHGGDNIKREEEEGEESKFFDQSLEIQSHIFNQPSHDEEEGGGYPDLGGLPLDSEMQAFLEEGLRSGRADVAPSRIKKRSVDGRNPASRPTSRPQVPTTPSTNPNPGPGRGEDLATWTPSKPPMNPGSRYETIWGRKAPQPPQRSNEGGGFLEGQTLTGLLGSDTSPIFGPAYDTGGDIQTAPAPTRLGPEAPQPSLGLVPQTQESPLRTSELMDPPPPAISEHPGYIRQREGLNQWLSYEQRQGQRANPNDGRPNQIVPPPALAGGTQFPYQFTREDLGKEEKVEVWQLRDEAMKTSKKASNAHIPIEGVVRYDPYYPFPSYVDGVPILNSSPRGVRAIFEPARNPNYHSNGIKRFSRPLSTFGGDAIDNQPRLDRAHNAENIDPLETYPDIQGDYPSIEIKLPEDLYVDPNQAQSFATQSLQALGEAGLSPGKLNSLVTFRALAFSTCQFT